MTKIIYTQDTVNYMLKDHKNLIEELDRMGKPEIKTIDKIQYYVFEIEYNKCIKIWLPELSFVYLRHD